MQCRSVQQWGRSTAVELSVYGHILKGGQSAAVVDEFFSFLVSSIVLYVYVVSSIFPGRRVAWCPFDSLCEEALGAVDFLALARTFRVVFISHVPLLSVLNKNQVHSFSKT